MSVSADRFACPIDVDACFISISISIVLRTVSKVVSIHKHDGVRAKTMGMQSGDLA